MPVEKILVLSTAHLDPNTVDALDSGIHFGIDDVFTREYGLIMFPAAIEASSLDGNAVPKCLLDAAEIARMEDCETLMYDSDGGEDGRLQTWDW